MPRKPWRESGWQPETLEDAELVARVDRGPPADLLDEAAKQDIAIGKEETRRAIRELPKAYTLIPAGSVPVHQFTGMLEDIERMAAQGLRGQVIAYRLGVEVPVLEQAAREYLDVRLALMGGAARGADELSANVYQAGVSGDLESARWLLQTRHGFEAPKNMPAVQVNVGGPVTPIPLVVDRASELARQQMEALSWSQDEESVDQDEKEVDTVLSGQ